MCSSHHLSVCMWTGRKSSTTRIFEPLTALLGTAVVRPFILDLSMADPVATAISMLALFVSGLTAWMNLFRRGSLRMTRPAFICFKYDPPDRPGGPYKPKLFVRSLLYSTGTRGRVIENMFIRYRWETVEQDFAVWGHGSPTLSRGSGLFVPANGIVENHHFTSMAAIDDIPDIPFSRGEHVLSVFAEVVGNRKPALLARIVLHVRPGVLMGRLLPYQELWFDWDPASRQYRDRLMNDNRSVLTN